MQRLQKWVGVLAICSILSGCLVTTVVGTAVSAATTVVGTAVDIADAVTPDILD